jgi:hypothetical protein
MKNIFIAFTFVVFIFIAISCVSNQNSSVINSSSLNSDLNIKSKRSSEETWAYFLEAKDRLSIYSEIYDITKENEKKALNKGEIPINTRTHKYMEYENGCFIIRIQSDRIYKFNDTSISSGIDFIQISYFDFEKREYIFNTGSYFNINNKPVKYSIIINSDNITERQISNKIYYVFNKSGKAIFSIIFNEISLLLDIDIIELPIKINSSVDTVIENIGLPDTVKGGGASWPNTKWVYGFLYSPSASKGIIWKDHYFYKKFPFLVLSVDNNKVDGIAYETLLD